MKRNDTRTDVRLSAGAFHVGGEPYFIYSGEVHYFRIPKAQWKDRLKKLKAAGFNAVSSYIPWIWHEPEERAFDFEGRTRPERDVLGFIDLAGELGLRFLARVGPVSNAELKHEGIPPWLIKGYPEVSVVGTRDVGSLPHVTMMSYLHPVFQEKVARWYDVLVPHVARRQVTKGGPVLGVQLCNEVAMVHWLQKGSDHKPHVNAMYRAFLKEKYRTVQALNAAHAASYGSFDEPEQPRGEGVELSRLAPHFDWALFYRRYYAAYFLSLSTRARALGVEVPLFCNIPQFYDYDVRGRGNFAPMTTSMFRDFPLYTPDLVFGGAYQMRHLDFENFHDVALTTEITRLLSAVRVDVPLKDAPDFAQPVEALPPLPAFHATPDADTPVVCAELQTGIMRDRPRLYPQQVALNVKSSVGQGLAGVNAYMFAGGVNPPGHGAFGTYHDWQAPIGPDGKEKPHLAPLRDFGRFLRWAGPLLAATRKVSDTTLGFYMPYYATEYYSGPWVERLEGQRTYLWYDGLARLVQLAGYSFNYTDLQRAPASVLAKFPSLWVYSLDFMDAETQAKLAAYVKGGGRLVLYPRLPMQDLLGRKDDTLARALGLAVSGEAPGNIFTRDGADHWVQGPIQAYRSDDAHEALVTVKEGAAALRKRCGDGEVLQLGFGLPHVFDHYRHWVRGWGESLGVKPSVECDPWDVQASLRLAADHGFLFVFNYHFLPRDVSVTLALPGAGGKVRLPGKGRFTLPALSGAVLPLNTPLAGGRRMVYCTAEALDLRSAPGRDELVLDAQPGREIELAVSSARRPRSVKADGKSVPAAVKGGRIFVSWRAAASSSRLTIVW
jgi:beta-galactosidase